jgi:hypothetical protein
MVGRALRNVRRGPIASQCEGCVLGQARRQQLPRRRIARSNGAQFVTADHVGRFHPRKVSGEGAGRAENRDQDGGETVQ